MNNWFKDFKRQTQLEQQTLQRFTIREYESLEEILYDLSDYLTINYGDKKFFEKKRTIC